MKYCGICDSVQWTKKQGKQFIYIYMYIYTEIYTLHDSKIRHGYNNLFLVKNQFIVHAQIHQAKKNIFLKTLRQTHAGSAIPLISNKTRYRIVICMDAHCATHCAKRQCIYS